MIVLEVTSIHSFPTLYEVASLSRGGRLEKKDKYKKYSNNVYERRSLCWSCSWHCAMCNRQCGNRQLAMLLRTNAFSCEPLIKDEDTNTGLYNAGANDRLRIPDSR